MEQDPRNTPRSTPEAVDREHEMQVGLLDAWMLAVREGQPDDVQDELLEQLTEYSRVHFLSEQLLMRLHAYGDHDAHVRDHEAMLASLEGFRAGKLDGSLEDVLDAAEHLRTFLLAHIAGRDHELGEHLRASGVGPAAG
jgi:hemerythrin